MPPTLGFTNEDYLNLILIHGETDKVAVRTIRLFRERYPNRPRPTRDTLARTLNNLKNIGSFKSTKKDELRPVINQEANQINVLAYFRAYPQNSLVDAERELGLSKSSVWRILKKHGMHPYRFQLVQHVKDTDFNLRIQFCEALLLKTQEDDRFLSRLIWSDESKFSKNGLFNRHNSHYWDESNNHPIRQHNFQESWSFNVFCAIKYGEVLAFHIYDGNLTGEKYLEILDENIEPFVRNSNEILWYQQDGAPPHNANAVSAALYRIFDDRWFANRGPHLWPPRSPDITPMDFYLWGRLKDLVYSTPITTKEDCVDRVTNAVRSLCQEELQRATQAAVIRRIHKCLEMNGHNFEQLL